MQFSIRGERLELTPALRDYVEKKIGRLEKYFHAGLESNAYVNLRTQRDAQVVEVTIPLPGLILRAEESSKDMYASIDLVVDKLERQIRKYKTRINRKSRQEGSTQDLFVNPGPEQEEAEEQQNPDVVRRKRFNLKPMTVDEAILQMDLLGHNFFVFENSESSGFNIVYRRNDGRYGLIEPEA